MIAVNILTTTPTPKLIAKPLTGPEPNTVKIPAVMITDTLASVIVERARLKPASMATRMDLPEKTSTLKRSKIRMFASTATPIDKIIPAMPGKVIVALKPLPNTRSNNITYTSNNIITLSESIENYNYIEFECDNNYSTEGYSYPFSQRYSVSQIKEHYSNTNEFVYKNVFWIIYNSGDYWNRVSFWLKDNKTIMFQYGRSTDTSVFNKIRITEIKGIK